MASRKKAPKWTPARQSERFSSLRDLSVTYEGHNENIIAHPPDISTQGMFINTARRFPEGAVLNLRFHLTRSKFQVVARSEVRYCLPGVGVGVEFVNLPLEAAHAIEREIRPSNGRRLKKRSRARAKG
jgi:hypothetical protein